MKILAIRGKNLASLGEFELDFQREPLASAGLYAITGATGAGKSTLLDALCLALYEQTPRLSGITGSGKVNDVGDKSIAPDDVRTILRRGCGDGYAEVDFVGNNTVSYRSRWSVGRARGKPDGNLQHTKISLERISDGQQLGDHRKTETLRLIQTFVGLTFEQFTRAVLLAQNDFTAFLKASDDARAELLQTLTGTESYAKISMLAFVRAKEEKEKLAQLEQQQQALNPATPEQIAEKSAQLQAKAEQVAAMAQQKAAIESDLRWYKEFDQLKAAQAEAHQVSEIALAAESAATPRAAVLRQVEKVQSARPLCAELARFVQAERDATTAHALAQSTLFQAQSDLDALQSKHDAAESELGLANAAKMQALPDIDAAKALDASIATIAPQVAAALREYNDAAAQLALEHSQQADANARLQSEQAKLAAAQKWLDSNEILRPLAESWPRWELLFAQAQKTLEQQTHADAQLVELTKALAAFEISLERAGETQKGAAQTYEQTKAMLKQLSADAAALDIDQLLADKAALERRLEQWQSAQILWQKYTEFEIQKQQLDQQLHGHIQALNASSAVVTDGAQALPLLACAEQTAKESWQLATLAASNDAETMRAALQPDKPCPVCGAAAHPYALHAPESNVLKSLQDVLATKQKAFRDAEIRLNSARESVQRSEKAISETQDSLIELEHDRALLNAEWASHPLHGEIIAVPELQRTQNLADRQNDVRHSLERVREKEALNRATIKRKDAAQQQLDADNIKLIKANDELANLHSQRNAVSQELATAQRDLAGFTAQLAAAQSQLDAAFLSMTWRGEWLKNPKAFVTHRHADVATWAAQMADVNKLTTSLAQLEITLSACEKARLQATVLQENRREKHAAVALELQKYTGHRSLLFAGKPIAQVEAALNSAVQNASNALKATDELMQGAQVKLAGNAEALSQAERRLAQQRDGAAAAQLSLDTWLARFNSENLVEAQALALTDLQELLNLTPDWIANERAALQELTRAVHTAQAVLEARTQSLNAHIAAQAVVESFEVLQEKLAQLQLEIDALAELVSALRLEIELDKQRVQQSAELHSKIENQTADARVWSQLGELIGSADGKKFRNFAQQLTLDILLKHANQHLQTLTRRYRVQRIKDSLGLMVVDQDMGDEVRSVHSLSGGESFLLSLALALALASLSSHRVQVESLFIDEGFGSLDAESLDIAMDALDNLQSQGRKVGVISHLQELTERISVKVQVRRLAGGLSKIVIV